MAGRAFQSWLLSRIALGLPLVALVPGCDPTPPPCDPKTLRVAVLDPTTLTPVAFPYYDARPIGDAGPAGAVGVAMRDCSSLCMSYASYGHLVLGRLTPIECSAEMVDEHIALSCSYRTVCGAVGRRPDGLLAAPRSLVSSRVGRWLADAAHLEAASVSAFEDLAEELDLHGAASLARAAKTCANDERRHAHTVGVLARLYGATPEPPRRSAREPRSLWSIAADNAVEGLVAETYGALAAAHQAERAQDPFIALAYRGIAADEAKHALFSARLDDWARTKLSARERRALDELHVAAHASLVAALHHEPDAAETTTLGLPSAEHATSLAALV